MFQNIILITNQILIKYNTINRKAIIYNNSNKIFIEKRIEKNDKK